MRALLFAAFLLAPGCLAQQLLHVREVQLGERLEAELGGGGNSVVLFHGEDALVIDVKAGDFARRLRREVEVEHQHHVRRVMLTHWHPDHTGGLNLFNDAEVVMVHPHTRERLVKLGQKAHWVDIEREVRLILGNEEVRIIHPGRGHTDGDLVAYFPNRKLLVAGDLFSVDTLPFCDLRSGGNILELSRSLERLLDLDFDRVVPGHGEVVPRAQLETLAAYLRELKKQAALAVERGVTPETAENEVKVAGFEQLKDFAIFGVNRKSNARDMVQALIDDRAQQARGQQDDD
jgi:glyoxylase-like metal-dependent hydrolase (beta-lactamase superfamily II)